MEGLFGAEFDIDLKPKTSVKDLVKKVKKPAKELDEEAQTAKLLKSKKLSIQERLEIITDKVIRKLGKQRSNTVVLRSLDDFSAYIDAAIEAKVVAIDTETNNSLDPITCKLMGLCLYVPGQKQAYIPVNHINNDTGELLPNQLTEEACRIQLQRILDNKVFVVMHNGKFDYEVIHCTCHIDVKPDWDTMTAARLIDENEKANLKMQYISKIDPQQEKYDIEGLFENVQYAQVDPDIFALYAATDSMMTYKLYKWQEPIMMAEENKRLRWVFENIEMPIVIVTAHMELRGVCVDVAFGERLKEKYNKLLADLDAQIDKKLEELKPQITEWLLSPAANEKTKIYVPAKTKMSQEKIEEMYTEIDENGDRFKYSKPKTEQLTDPINLASPVQLAILFYDILQCPTVNDTKPRATGSAELKKLAEVLAKYKPVDEEDEVIDDEDEEEETTSKESSVNDSVLEAIENEAPEEKLLKARIAAADFCQLLLKRRGYMKLITTYIDVIPDLAKHWPDGRIRFHLNATGTDTGRYSSGGKLKFFENGEPVVVSGINIQNIPSRGEGKLTRSLFKAKEEYTEVSSENKVFKLLEIAEIKTADGWKYCKDIKVGDLISTKTGFISFTSIKQENKFYYFTSLINETIKVRTRYRIVGSDYSAQEPRLTAFLSQDPAMIDAYKQGKDLYCVIAQGMYNNNYEDNLEFYPEGTEIELDGKKIICGKKTHLHKAGKERRASAKTMLLAATYGMSGKTAGIRMGKDKKAGEELLNNFFSSFPEVKKTIEASKESLRKTGYVEDWAGRRRHLPDYFLPPYEVVMKKQSENDADFNPFLGCANRTTKDPKQTEWEGKIKEAVAKSNAYQYKTNPDFKGNDEMSNVKFRNLAKEALKEGVILKANTGRRAQAERQCFNARIQGGAASLTKLAMVNIENDPELNRYDAHLIITVHDEVLVECPALYADEVEKRLPQVMIDTAKPYINVPMSCDPYNVDHWYAEEAAVLIEEEFKHLEENKTRDEAFEALYKNHPEFTKESMYNTIVNGAELQI